MSVLFAASDPIAVPAFRALYEHGAVGGLLITPHALYRQQRRGKTKDGSEPSELARIAREYDIPVFSPKSLDAQARDAVCPKDGSAMYRLLVCFAYGKYFPESFLHLFALGSINVHPSLLPRFRGASPIAAALLAGDTRTGVTIQTISKDIDCGDIYAQVEVAVAPPAGDAGAGTGRGGGFVDRQTLGERLSAAAVEPLVQVTAGILAGQAGPGRKQHDADAVYCRKITKHDGRVNWNMPAGHIARLVRAMSGWPGAYTTFAGTRMAILCAVPLPEQSGNASTAAPAAPAARRCRPGETGGVDKEYGLLVQTGDGVLAIQRVQMAGKRALDWKEFLNGYPRVIGTLLE